MHKAESCIKDLYYGFSKDSLFIRVDPVVPFDRLDDKVSLLIDIYHPFVYKIVFDPSVNIAAAYEKRNEDWVQVETPLEAASSDIFEIGIPFSLIKAKENDEVHFALEVVKSNGSSIPVGEEATIVEKSIERCPLRGHVMLTVPSEDFEKLMWY